jgi:acyl-CoA dehydrogenase
MNLGISERLEPILEAVKAFIRDKVDPANEAFNAEIDKGGRWTLTDRQVEILEGLKADAREQNLWNFWLTDSDRGHGLTTVEYAYIAEETGRSHLAAEAFNCSAPDTGNMEVLERFGSDAQKEEWLAPLLDGKIRSAYAMTEPGVASSDATNISTTAVLDNGEWVINGEKSYISGAGDPRCKILICMVKTDPDGPRHQQHSQILVPMDAPGVEVVRPMQVLASDSAPHGHMHLRFEDVRIPETNIILGPGLAEARMNIDMVRLLTLRAAWVIDNAGVPEAQVWISKIKAAVPSVVIDIIDDAIQMHGASGLSQDFPLAEMYTHARTLRLADGPDEVHRMVVARNELRSYIER